MTKRKPALQPVAPEKRGRGRPSNAEIAARAAMATMAAAAAQVSAPSPAPVESQPLPGAQEATPLRALIATLAVLGGPPEPVSAPILPPAPPAPPPAPTPAARAEPDLAAMSENDRNDPRKLWGQALRDFAHRRGAASRSAMEGWSDEKLREQVEMVVYRQYHEYA